MFGRKTLDRVEHMLDEAIAGNFQESDYDETHLSKLESKWKQYLGMSVLTRENMEKEKENVKSLVSDISHQTKTPMANIQLYAELLRENLESGPDFAQKSQNLKLLNEIGVQAKKLDFLIQSLTKLSRLESNIVEVRPVRQKLSELIGAAIQDVRLKAEHREIEIINTYGGTGSLLAFILGLIGVPQEHEPSQCGGEDAPDYPLIHSRKLYALLCRIICRNCLMPVMQGELDAVYW